VADDFYFVDEGRRLDNKVQRAQRIIPKAPIKTKTQVYRVNPAILPFVNKEEHLQTVVG
jgi:hypothetical protein